ncbi:hypothetical protein ACH518_17235 [Methylomonas sp. HW2-6]|uniref:hypothetical protein n=1 Tax=Methylomonas sp. HW2-6 TaxID=3376687 RepID=UPI00404328EA
MPWGKTSQKGPQRGHTFSREAHTKSPMPRRAPEGLGGQIGRIADLHAQHPQGEVHGCTE